MNGCLKSALLFTACLAAMIFSSDAGADTVILKSGEEITCIVVREDENYVEVEIFLGGGIMTTGYPRGMVSEIIKDAGQNARLLKEHGNSVRGAEDEERARKETELEREAAEQKQKTAEEMEKKRREYEKQLKEMEETAEASRKEREEKKKQKEKEDKAYRFGEVSRREEYEPPVPNLPHDDKYYRVYYKGTFHNEGSLTKKHVIVRMTFYDSSKKIVAKKVGYTSPADIEPKKSGTFEVSVDKSLEFKTFKLSATWEY